MVSLDRKIVDNLPEGTWILAQNTVMSVRCVGRLEFDAGGVPSFRKIRGNSAKDFWRISAWKNYYQLTDEEAMLTILEF